MMNLEDTFLVVKREEPEELRFYNRASIIRVEYEGSAAEPAAELTRIACQLHMMDGSLIDGTIQEALPPDRSRLLDYLNWQGHRFIRLYVDGGTVYLINKSYIIRATDLGGGNVAAEY